MIKPDDDRFVMPEAKILIVDDVMANLKTAADMLKPYGAQVGIVKGGAESVNAVKKRDYDLIFMDHSMPETDGVTATRAIRGLGAYDDLIIIALTENVSGDVTETLLNSGFNDCMPKPVETDRLHEILTKWIPEHKRIGQPPEPADGVLSETESTHENISIPGVNVKKGVYYSGDSVKNYLETLAVFRRDGLIKVFELTSCLKNAEYGLYTTYVHALKSREHRRGKSVRTGKKTREKTDRRGSGSPAFFSL